MDDYKLYTPNQPRKKNHFILKFLFRLIIDAVILGLIGWGLINVGNMTGFTYTGGITITSPWGGQFIIGNPDNANNNVNKKISTDDDSKKTNDSSKKTNDADNNVNNNKHSNDSNTNSKPTDVSGLTDVEKKISDFEPELGTDGTYRNSASELVKLAGAEIKWNLQNIPCTGTASSQTVAIYCSTTPNVIYVNESHQDYDTLARSSAFIDSIKHELAHREIDQLCHTTDPAVANGRTEALANSYAVLFFNANRSSFDNTNTIGLKTPLAYVPDDDSDNMAKQVHANNCGVSDNTTTNTTGE